MTDEQLKERFVQVEALIYELESKWYDMQNTIDTLESTVDDMKWKIERLEDKFSDLEYSNGTGELMTNKNLKSLEVHNAEVLSRGIQPFDKSILRNGIACPGCGCELYDGCSIVPITMDNHQREVFCMSCNYRGSRRV